MTIFESPSIDKSWMEAYDVYLQHFSNTGKAEETPEIDAARRAMISNAHTSTLNNLFHAINAKKPVQNIYKRPI